MKCALVIPAWQPEQIFSTKTSASQINYWQPIGTLYVAASLLQAGHEVIFLNGALLKHNTILERIAAYQPHVVGLYATTFGWRQALQTARDVKRWDKHLFICAGGPYPIAMKDQCLRQSGPVIDAVIMDEAELTMVDLLNHLQARAKSTSLDQIPGIIYWHKGEIRRTSARPLIEDLDTLPFPARQLLGDQAKYIPAPATYRRTPVAVMITSRGCSRRCIFCFQIDRRRECGRHGVRFRSVDNVLLEIRECLQQGYREIKFIDDSLVADYDRAMVLSQAIKAQQLDFTWFASACVNQVDRPLLQAMKDAGCWAILLGAESGVQKNLNTLRKGTTLAQIRNAVKTAQSVGLKVSTPFLFGIPGETYNDGLKTIEFALDLNPDLANFHAMTAFPGTELYENRERYGTVSQCLTDYTYQGSAFVPYTMRREEIMQLRQLALKRFYSRPSFLLRRLCSLRTRSDIRAAYSGIRSLIALWWNKNLFQHGKVDTSSPTE